MNQLSSLFVKNLFGFILLTLLFSNTNILLAQPFKLELIENPSGFFTPRAINNSGQIAGNLYSTEDFQNHGQRREANGQYSDLAELNYSGSIVNDINQNGDLCGYRLDSLGFGYPGMWVETNFRALEIPGDAQYTPSANGINNDRMVAGDYIDTLSQIHALVWDSTGKATRLPESTATASFADAINKNGDITGTIVKPDGTFMAVLWRRENDSYTLVELGTLGGRNSQSTAMNNRGQIVGFANYNTNPDLIHGFLWQNGEIHDLGTLGGENSRALAINDAGLICGTAQIDTTPQPKTDQNNIFLDLYKRHPLTGTINKRPGASNRILINETYRAFWGNWNSDQMQPFIFNIQEYSDGKAAEAYGMNLQQHMLIYDLEMGHYYISIPQYLAFISEMGSVMPELGSPFSPYSSITDAEADMDETWNSNNGFRRVYKFELGHFRDKVDLTEGTHGIGSWDGQRVPDFTLGGPLTIHFDDDVTLGSTASLVTFGQDSYEFYFGKNLDIKGELTYKDNEFNFDAESGEQNSINFGEESTIWGDGPFNFNGLGSFLLNMYGDMEGNTDIRKEGSGTLFLDPGDNKVEDVYNINGVIHLKRNVIMNPNGILFFNEGKFEGEEDVNFTLENPDINAVSLGKGYFKYGWFGRMIQYTDDHSMYDFPVGGDSINTFSVGLEANLDQPLKIDIRYKDWDQQNIEFDKFQIYMESQDRWIILDRIAKPTWDIMLGGPLSQSTTLKTQPMGLNHINYYNCLHLLAVDLDSKIIRAAGGDIFRDSNLLVDGNPCIIANNVMMGGNESYLLATNDFINKVDAPPSQVFVDVQIINATSDQTTLKSYINDKDINWPLNSNLGTPYGIVDEGETIFDIVYDNDPDNSNPKVTITETLNKDNKYQFIISGSDEEKEVLVNDKAVKTSRAEDMVEITVLNTVIWIPSLNLTIKTEDQETEIAKNLIQNEFSEPKTVVPGIAEIPLLGKLFRMNLSKNKGQGLVILVIPKIIVDKSDNISQVDSTDFTLIGIDNMGNLIESEDITSLDEQNTSTLPSAYHLAQNFPNPFNPSTQINYQLPQNAHVNLVIYDQLGQVVRKLVNREQMAGFYSVQWNGINELGSTVGSGIYLYHLEVIDTNSDSFVNTKKMLFLK